MKRVERIYPSPNFNNYQHFSLIVSPMSSCFFSWSILKQISEIISFHPRIVQYASIIGKNFLKKQHGCNAFIILNKFNEKLFIIPSHPSRSNFPIVLKMSLISWFVLIRSHTQFMHYIYLLRKLGHLSSWRISHTLGLPDCILVLFTCSYVPCISCKLIIRLKGPIRFRFIIRGWCLLLPHITLSVTLKMIPRLRQVRRVSTLTTFYLMVLVLIGNRCQIYYFSQVCKMVSN